MSGGYTHGMLTVLVPPDVAKPLAQTARLFGIDVTTAARQVLRIVADDPSFFEDVLGYRRTEEARPK